MHVMNSSQINSCMELNLPNVPAELASHPVTIGLLLAQSGRANRADGLSALRGITDMRGR